jgi:hypothetical protein
LDEHTSYRLKLPQLHSALVESLVKKERFQKKKNFILYFECKIRMSRHC